MDLRSGPLRANLMLAYSLGKFNSLSKLYLNAARSNMCRLLATSRVESQRQLQSAGPKTSVSSKGNWKRQDNIQRVDVLNRLISPINLPEVILVVRGMDMVTLHLDRRENCLLMSKRKRILGLRLSRN